MQKAEIGICKLLGVTSANCDGSLFANVKVWEGSTYFQFQLAGSLVAGQDTLASLASEDNHDAMSSAIGYPVMEASSSNTSPSVSSSNKIAGMPRGTAIGVFVGISLGVVFIAAIIVVLILLIRKRGGLNFKRTRTERSTSSIDLIGDRGRRNNNSSMYSSQHVPSHGSNPMFGGSSPPMLKVGSRCEAYWAEDGKYYSAKVDDVDGERYYVTFIEFGNGTWVHKSALR